MTDDGGALLLLGPSTGSGRKLKVGTNGCLERIDYIEIIKNFLGMTS